MFEKVCKIISFFILILSLNVNAHGVSPVIIDAGFKPSGVKFPVKIRVYNKNKKTHSAEVFIRQPDNVIKVLGETTQIKPGGYDKGVDINVILYSRHGVTEVCTKMKSDNLNFITVICTKVNIKTPGEKK